MAEIVLVTGGSRSGKSGYAQSRAEALGGKRVFVATCPEVDAEMEERIRRHRRHRQGRGWETREEPVELERVLRMVEADVVLVDCLTLWVSNLMYAAAGEGRDFGEDEVEESSAGVMEACAGRAGKVFFVTNEVGSGIVPENPLARRFRDLVGRCNQTVAGGADEVVLLVSGIPVRIK